MQQLEKPGQALPSGADFGLFLWRLKYELYNVRSKTARDAIGGSSAEEAGVNQMVDPPADEIAVSNQEDIELSSVGDETATDNVENTSGGTRNQDHNETLDDFYPARLLAIMTIGVLSNDIKAVLGFVEDNPHGKNAKTAPN
jgi:hypothetical protein